MLSKCGHEESLLLLILAHLENNDVIRRRRECMSCKFRFTTYERLEEIPITVVTKRWSQVEPLIDRSL